MNHPLRCQCGAVKGFVTNPRKANRTICYCKDCQAFAYFLKRDQEILDERGGSDVIQTLPKYVTITEGIEKLACMRLTHKGLLRWYASCCNSAIGNTMATPKLSFVGLVHTCLASESHSLDEVFGPVRVWNNTSTARGEPKLKDAGLGPAVVWALGMILKARLNGDYKHTPFFRRETGAPIVTPNVLSNAEWTGLMSSVQAAAR
jgi:hypothetical protein